MDATMYTFMERYRKYLIRFSILSKPQVSSAFNLADLYLSALCFNRQYRQN